MPCTTILIGKGASYDGSTMMARSEDSGPGFYKPKKFIVVKPEEQPRHYVSKLSGVTIELPDDPMRYTAMPNATDWQGIWAEAGINAANVAMSETETITSNPRVQGADPLVKGGIGEEDMLTIVLPYIHSAREGVQRLGSLLEEFGTYEMNGIGFQDLDEIWWMETIGGHHWMARRVPDDCYVVMPNQQGIDSFSFKDAYGEKKDHLCSADLADFVLENHLDLSMSQEELYQAEDFDARAAFGSHTESDHCYNTPRAWYMLRYLNPNTCQWDGPMADYTPLSDDLPWCMIPEKKVTPEDVKFILSSYYQGTEFDPYGKYGKGDSRGRFRPIGINRNAFTHLTQLRPGVPEEVMGVEWLAEGSNAFNAMIPFYTNVNTTPEYMANTTDLVDTNSFYWANRIIGALADAHYSECIAMVERYQAALAAAGHRILKKGDKAVAEQKDASAYLEACNQEMADEARKQTDELLSKVLLTASNLMKNSFSRADG